VTAGVPKGLGRFVEDGGQEAHAAPPEGLRRFLERPSRPAPGERCELCAEPLSEAHAHVANLDSRAILCTCRACYLLFTHEGAAKGRYRAVPERYHYDPGFALTDAQWDAMQIPVRIAFLFVNSSLDRMAAFYPSPAGATESLLPPDTWAEILAANPAFAGIAPDVEALLVHRQPERCECYLVPIDACYQLVGLVRLHWKGFDGGQEAWREIDAFFAGLRARSGAHS
jgi:Family of unknown function (DUF5947)